MIMMSFISIPLVTVAWLLVGYTIAFSDGSAGGLVGSLKHIGMLGINPDTARGPVPELLFATFQLGFAIVTAALVSGAIADRAKFAAWMAFVPLWTIAVAVVAHWVWEPCGWLFELGALDYAGGLVVEIVSGMSALALAHRRVDPRRQADHIRCSLSVVAGLVAIVGLGGHRLLVRGRGEIPVRLRRFTRRDRCALRRWGRWCAADRIAGHRSDDRRPQGLFYGGGFAQLGKHALGALVVGLYAFVVSYVLAKVIDRFMGFRVSAEEETTGVGFTQHAETAYTRRECTGISRRAVLRRPATSARRGSATRESRRRLNLSRT